MILSVENSDIQSFLGQDLMKTWITTFSILLKKPQGHCCVSCLLFCNITGPLKNLWTKVQIHFSLLSAIAESLNRLRSQRMWRKIDYTFLKITGNLTQRTYLQTLWSVNITSFFNYFNLKAIICTWNIQNGLWCGLNLRLAWESSSCVWYRSDRGEWKAWI